MEQHPHASRRTILRTAVAAAATSTITLAPVSFATASSAAADQTRVVTGHLDPGAVDFVYLPVQVPAGVREIAVSYSYDRPDVPAGTPGSSCDVGVFDERGTALGGPGFRGWSGGFRTSFAISASTATPGYLPGPVRAGTWHVVLGPYQVAPQGLDYRVEVTLRFGAPGVASVPQYSPTGVRWHRQRPVDPLRRGDHHPKRALPGPRPHPGRVGGLALPGP